MTFELTEILIDSLYLGSVMFITKWRKKIQHDKKELFSLLFLKGFFFGNTIHVTCKTIPKTTITTHHKLNHHNHKNTTIPQCPH